MAELRQHLTKEGFDDPVVVHFGSESEATYSHAGAARIKGLLSVCIRCCTVSDEAIDLRRVDFVGLRLVRSFATKVAQVLVRFGDSYALWRFVSSLNFVVQY